MELSQNGSELKVPPRLETPLLLARTIRGLENISGREISDNGWGALESVSHREVFFRPSHANSEVLDLRTVDDVFLVVHVAQEVGTTKADLADFGARLREEEFRTQVLAAMSEFPHYAGRMLSPQFNVSASFLGKRNYTRFDIEDVVGEAICQSIQGTYHSRRNEAVPPKETASWRVMIRDGEAVIAIRLGQSPLHRRAYKTASIPGTVHPPVAAAMAKLAEIHFGHKVLDPCCGAGTILIEAAIEEPGAHYRGFDASPESLAAAIENSESFEVVECSLGDAGRLALGDSTIDRIVVNPPWGQQVDARETLLDRPAALWLEARRVLREDGLLVALMDFPREVRSILERFFTIKETIPVSLFGSHPEIVLARPR
jgi:23S rRNA G2445 N2-methylase RlmL